MKLFCLETFIIASIQYIIEITFINKVYTLHPTIGKQLMLTASMLKYHEYLKCKYKVLPLSSPKETLECKSPKYVSLRLTKLDENSKIVNQNLESGSLHIALKNQTQGNESLTFADMLNVREENKLILVEGDPGMGKSTLAIEICKCWADGELLEEYDAVILLLLRDPEIQGATNIGDLLLVENKNEREALYNEITTSQGNRIFFIFEGYDELPEKLREAPVFAKLRENLPKCTLMYTSRREACYQLRQIAPHKIEILGFKEEQVDEYIDNAFKKFVDGKEKALKLKSQIKSNPAIRNIMAVPINVAIVCHLFLLIRTLPNTLTELYTLLCLNLILRHIIKYSLCDIDYLKSLHDLPMGIKEEFDKLCLIAYKGREDNKIIFSSSDIDQYNIDSKKLKCLGLLLIAPSTSVCGREKSYNFLHLTIQEFFAAFYISTLSDEVQYECLKKHHFNGKFQTVWRMYSGITRLKNKDIFRYVLPSKWIESQYMKKTIVNLFHCVYEARDYKLCQDLVSYLEGKIDFSMCTMDQTGCGVLVHLLEQYKGTLKFVNLNHCNIDDEGCNILLNFLLLQDKSCSSNIELHLWSNRITDKSSLLIALLLSTNYAVAKLDIGRNKLSSSTDIIFKSLHQNKVLIELFFRYSSLRSSNMQSLGQMLTENNTLSIIDISGNDIGSDGCEYLAVCRNVSLNKLVMDNCKLGVGGADKIGEMLYHNRSITSIGLGLNSICDDGIEKLISYLKFNSTIKHLGLWDNKITSIGASHLKELFSCSHTNINNIQLSDNPLKDEGVDLILQSMPITMEYISVYGTQMTSSCSSLYKAFHKVESISFTPLDYCDDITDCLAGTTVLKEVKLVNGSDISNYKMINALKRNNTIKQLRFKYGQLSHQTLSDLVKVINVNNIITDLVMDDMDIFPNDYLLLADLLNKNTSIKEMVIFPPFKKELEHSLVLQFLKQFGHNCTLEVLTLRVIKAASTDCDDDDRFIRNVEILVEDNNNIRKSRGVTTLLQVKLK